jgi:hypothetical protein
VTLYLLLAASQFTFVFLKAFQQRNVAFDNFIAVIPVSVLMAAIEVFVVVKVASTGWHPGIVLAIGLSAGVGAVSAMLLHRKMFPQEPGR